MDAKACWELFRATGQPLFYLLYQAESAQETQRES